MARRRDLEVDGEELDRAIVDWYRDLLGGPAVPPWRGLRWEPVCIGPTWQVGPDGGWLLPERTLGWQVLAWAGTWLQHRRDEPWRCTPEQARWILWWFSLDETGRFLYRDGVLQRLKGWGKDPVGALLCAVEAFGPCRFAGWQGDEPVATDNPEAWVQTAAVALEQTKNTMRLFPGMLTAEARRRYRIQLGKELVHGMGDERLVQAVTSSPTTLEGARATFVLKNETHHWTSSNSGHDMAEVIDRNATKSPDGAARALAITNAYEPSEDSVAQRDREAWEAATDGRTLTSGILYDSLEAPADAPLTAEAAAEVVAAVRGDSSWLKVDRITEAILDTRNPASRSRRWWFNQVVAAEDAWVRPVDVDAATSRDVTVAPAEPVVLFFDGSKSDDATGLVACRLSDGFVETVGVWQKPAGAAGEHWTVNRSEVDLRVRAVLDARNVVAFWADPSHAQDDDTVPFWKPMIDGWHRDYGSKLVVWARESGHDRHAVMWDMSSHERQRQFIAAAELFAQELEPGAADAIRHDGHPALRQHMKNARRWPTKWGISLGKEHRGSARKIDLAVCAVGARMLRRVVLNSGKLDQKRSGVVW